MSIGKNKSYGKLKGAGTVIRKDGTKEPFEFDIDVAPKNNSEEQQKTTKSPTGVK